MVLNVSEDMTVTVGVNKTESVGVNASENVGGLKSTTVAGDMNIHVAGMLDEYIEGDVRSETKKGKTSINMDKGMETNSQGAIAKHSTKEVQVNSAEKSKLF